LDGFGNVAFKGFVSSHDGAPTFGQKSVGWQRQVAYEFV